MLIKFVLQIVRSSYIVYVQNKRILLAIILYCSGQEPYCWPSQCVWVCQHEVTVSIGTSEHHCDYIHDESQQRQE